MKYRDELVYSFQSTVYSWGPRCPTLKGGHANTKFIATDYTDEYRDEKVYSFQSTVYGWGSVSSLKLNAILTPALSILLRAHAGRGEGGIQNTRFTTDGRPRCPALSEDSEGWLRRNTKFITTDYTDEYRDEKVYSFQSTVYSWGPGFEFKI